MLTVSIILFIERFYSPDIGRQVDAHFSPEIRRCYRDVSFFDGETNRHHDEAIIANPCAANCSGRPETRRIRRRVATHLAHGWRLWPNIRPYYQTLLSGSTIRLYNNSPQTGLHYVRK